MKEPYIEGLANHNDPESCVDIREDMGEALTGAYTGGAIEPREGRHQDADTVPLSGRQHEYGRNWQGYVQSCAVCEPQHV